MACSCLATAQKTADTVWIMDSNGCKVRNAHPVRSETITWTGGCLNGYANGDGILTWLKNGKRNQEYKGILKRGIPNGAGVYDFLEGSVFEGNYIDGELHGQGQVTYSDKNQKPYYTYKGNFVHEKREGMGTEIRFDEVGDTTSVYVGEFSNGNKNGAGVLTYFGVTLKRITKGPFVDDEPSGLCEVWEFNKGKEILCYHGEIKDHYYNGTGELKRYQTKYVGEWKGGAQNGKGKLL